MSECGSHCSSNKTKQKMVIHFNRGKTISKEDMAKHEASIEYTYAMASQVLPIFVQ